MTNHDNEPRLLSGIICNDCGNVLPEHMDVTHPVHRCPHVPADDEYPAAMAINLALEELQSALTTVRNPEQWAEKHPRSLERFLANTDRVITVLERMSTD